MPSRNAPDEERLLRITAVKTNSFWNCWNIVCYFPAHWAMSPDLLCTYLCMCVICRQIASTETTESTLVHFIEQLHWTCARHHVFLVIRQNRQCRIKRVHVRRDTRLCHVLEQILSMQTSPACSSPSAMQRPYFLWDSDSDSGVRKFRTLDSWLWLQP